MDQKEELKNAATTAAKKRATKVPDDVTVEDMTESDVVAETEEEDDDAVVILGATPSPTNAKNKIVETDDTINEFVLTDDDLKADCPDIDNEETFGELSATIRMQINNYRKSLIIRSGFTIDEADEAARNRAKKTAQEANTKYITENPKLGIIEVNKKDADKLEFTEEEKDKMSKVKALKLVIIEDQELKTLKIEKVEKKHKSAYLQTIDGNLSKYDMPLPLTADFVSFKGAQIIQLVTAIKYNDEGIDELVSKKASLVYDRLERGSILAKYDENHKNIMSYNEFLNLFRFSDLDMALYAILCASSMEDIETTLHCSQCGEPFQWHYNLKNLLNLDEISEVFKELMDDILGCKDNEIKLKVIRAKNDKILRVKSPISGNIYDLGYPNLAKTINLYKSIDQQDQVMMYHSTLGLFIDGLLIYNKTTDSYVEIESDEYKEMMEMLQIIPQEDIELLQNLMKDRVYVPKFVLKSKCPLCGTQMTNDLGIDDLVFLKARDSKTEIM